MGCPQCQAENPDGAQACSQCGGPLIASCAACGAQNPPGNRFCGQCGAALDTSLGELRQVTLLFCDIVDSTGLTERLGAEAMHDLLRSFLDTALAVVHRYEGSAPQFLGDGFMALFGAPVAHEDHVRRALLAALAIQEAASTEVGRTNQDRRSAPSVRIGIHTGLVVFGAVAATMRMDHTAIGDAANVAARLQEAADPGTILISEETLNLGQGHAQVTPVGPLRLKGKTEPVSAYRLLGYSHRGSPQPEGTAPGKREFVGRDRELATLDELLQQIKGGRGQAVGVVGEPGIGKSRLLAEFRERIPAEDISWIEGRCVSYGTAIPYLLALDVLRSMCGIIEGDSQEVLTAKLRLALQKAEMDADEAAPLLLRLLGIYDASSASSGSSPEALRAKTLEIFCRFVLDTSRIRPLILALEDLQWIDKLSEDVVGPLIAGIADAPILVIAAYRPEYQPPWLDAPYARQILLQPLNRRNSRRMVRSVLSGKPAGDPLTAQIVEKGDGNPLFLEQLALQAAESGHRLPPDAVPGTIRDVVMARIDRLPEETKRLLQTAAVIGREFSYHLLDAVRRGRGPLDAHLRELTRLEFIRERAESEGTAYVFRHALAQETAYASLLARYRRSHHADIGRALERLYAGRSEEVADLLAFHFGLSEIADKAIDYAIAAGEKAQRRWANPEALTYFDAALQRLGSMPDTPANRLRHVDAVLKQAEIRYALGQYGEHLHALEGVRKLVEESGDARRLATWHYWTGFLHATSGGQPDEAIEYCREAARIASAAGLDDIGAFAESCLAQIYMVAGRLAEAIVAGERALANFEARGNLWWAGRTLWLLSATANYLGEWEASLDYCGRGLSHGTALGDLRLKVAGWTRLGTVHILRGGVDQGIACCEEALALQPIPRDAAWASVVRGYGRIKAGQIDDGIAELREALAWFESSRMRWTYIIGAVWLAEGHLARGDRASARPLVERILLASRETGYRQYEGRGCWLMAECLAGGTGTAAKEYIGRALRIFEQIGARNDVGKALITQAALQQDAGEAEMARQSLERAGALFRELGSKGEMARVEAAIATLRRDAER